MGSNVVKVREDTGVDLSIRNLISIVIAVAISVWAYFGIIERLNNIETNYKLVNSDIEKNTDFRIRWPLGELGALPDDAQQFMLIDHMQKVLDEHEKQLESGMHNKVNIEFMQTQIEKLTEELEKLEDRVKRNGNGKPH